MSTLYRRPLSSLVTDALQKADLLAVEIRKERKNERMNERTNERTKERMNERMNKRKKERNQSHSISHSQAMVWAKLPVPQLTSRRQGSIPDCSHVIGPKQWLCDMTQHHSVPPPPQMSQINTLGHPAPVSDLVPHVFWRSLGAAS